MVTDTELDRETLDAYFRGDAEVEDVLRLVEGEDQGGNGGRG